MCNSIPYTQNVDTIRAIAMQTEYHAVSSPRISAGAISTMETGPVTLKEPIPKPETIRAAYNPDVPGLNMATNCPIIHMKVYSRKDHRRPIRSLMRKDKAAPAALPMYTSETKFLVELAPDSELMPKCRWKPDKEETVAADP